MSTQKVKSGDKQYAFRNKRTGELESFTYGKCLRTKAGTKTVGRKQFTGQYARPSAGYEIVEFTLTVTAVLSVEEFLR